MQMTLDGFIEGPKGEMNWLISGEEEWQEMLKDLRSVDTMMLGRKMYSGCAGYWRAVLADPSTTGYLKEYAQLADRTPHIVLSGTMSTYDWNNTGFAADALKEVRELKKKNGTAPVIVDRYAAVSVRGSSVALQRQSLADIEI